MRFDAPDGGLVVEADFLEHPRIHEIPGGAGTTCLPDQLQLKQSVQPMAEIARILQFECPRQLSGHHPLALCQGSQRDALPLPQLVALIGQGDESDDGWMEDTLGNGDVHRVDLLANSWCWPSADKQSLIHQIKSTSLPFHQLEVVEKTGDSVVATAESVKNVAGG